MIGVINFVLIDMLVMLLNCLLLRVTFNMYLKKLFETTF